MTKVRTCPGCADRVNAGDAFCEGCGRTLPDEVRRATPEPEGPGRNGTPLGAPREDGDSALSSVTARGRPEEGDWTTPSGARWDRPSDHGEHAHTGGTSLTDSLAVDSEWDQIDALATQPVRRGADEPAVQSAGAVSPWARTVEELSLIHI